MRPHAALAFVLFAALIADPAPGQDWPGWRGAGRDGKLPGFEAPDPWPAKLVRGWRVEVGTGHSTPALVAGRLHVHARQKDDEVTLCLDAETGKVLWRDRYPAPYEMDPTATEHGKGPRSSVAVADGRLFTLGINGVLSCLDTRTGRVVWRHDFKERFPETSPRYGTAMSPLVCDGLCIVHVGGPGEGAIVAFEAGTGKERWSWNGDGPAYASPVIGTIGGRRQLITQTQFHAVGLSPADGKLLWKLAYKTSFDQNSVTPLIFGDRVILSGYHNGTTAYRLDGEAPERVWKTRKVSMYMSTPVLHGERFFGFSEKRRGQFVCVDANTGKTLWSGDGRQGENAALLDGGQVILALNTRAELIVFKASDRDYEELARYKVADTPTWAHPVISGRTVFVKDLNSVIQWKLPRGDGKK
jgi:outer membrane protein assembly factor BamB